MKRRVIAFTYFLVFCVTSISDEAFSFQRPSVTFSSPAAQLDLVQKVVVVGEDNREPLEDYARRNKLSKSHFAATGLLICEDSSSRSTVQVVNSERGCSNVVVTTKHQFYNACQLRPISTCRITFRNSNSSTPYTIKATTLTPEGCPKDDTDNSATERYNKGNDTNKDWAILELDRPVQGVEPYGIPIRNSSLADVGTSILTISAGSDGYIINGRRVPYVSACLIRDRAIFPTFPVQTDCRLANGASGAAQLVDVNERPKVAAVHAGGTNTQQPGTPYHRHTMFNSSKPLEGDFLEAVYQALDRNRKKNQEVCRSR
jgi:hypothetical protein